MNNNNNNIWRKKHVSHLVNYFVHTAPLLLMDLCHCKVLGNGREMSFDLESL